MCIIYIYKYIYIYIYIYIHIHIQKQCSMFPSQWSFGCSYTWVHEHSVYRGLLRVYIIYIYICIYISYVCILLNVNLKAIWSCISSFTIILKDKFFIMKAFSVQSCAVEVKSSYYIFLYTITK